MIPIRNLLSLLLLTTTVLIVQPHTWLDTVLYALYVIPRIIIQRLINKAQHPWTKKWPLQKEIIVTIFRKYGSGVTKDSRALLRLTSELSHITNILRRRRGPGGGILTQRHVKTTFEGE